MKKGSASSSFPTPHHHLPHNGRWRLQNDRWAICDGTEWTIWIHLILSNPTIITYPKMEGWDCRSIGGLSRWYGMSDQDSPTTGRQLQQLHVCFLTSWWRNCPLGCPATLFKKLRIHPTIFFLETPAWFLLRILVLLKRQGKVTKRTDLVLIIIAFPLQQFIPDYSNRPIKKGIWRHRSGNERGISDLLPGWIVDDGVNPC